jgi:hypothetical protein
MSDIGIIREKNNGVFSSSSKLTIEIKNYDANTDEGNKRLIGTFQTIIRDMDGYRGGL